MNAGIIGGAIASEDVSPGLVALMSTCTATRIGEREILLAAHCVIDKKTGGTRARYQPGTGVSYFAGSDLCGRALDKSGSEGDLIRSIVRSSTVDAVIVHPSYLAAVKAAILDPLTGERRMTIFDLIDVAVIRFRDPLPADIRTRRIARRPAVAGEEVVVAGFGSESIDDHDDRWVMAKSRPLSAETVQEMAARPDLIQPPGMRDPICAPEKCLYLPGGAGQLLEGPASGEISNGDSGGPIFVKRGGELAVAAVIASMRLATAKGDNLYSVAVRVDRDSADAIGPWLEALGATVAD